MYCDKETQKEDREYIEELKDNIEYFKTRLSINHFNGNEEISAHINDLLSQLMTELKTEEINFIDNYGYCTFNTIFEGNGRVFKE